MTVPMLTLPDGRVFPRGPDGEPLSWSIDIYNTLAEERAGYPRLRAVVYAMREHRPEQYARIRRELDRDCLGKLFGHVARRLRTMLDSIP